MLQETIISLCLLAGNSLYQMEPTAEYLHLKQV